MTDRPPDALPAEYVRVLRGFGLPDAEIVDLHDGETETVADVRGSLGDAPRGTLYDRLHATLARSTRGIDATLEFWNRVPAVQLEGVLSAYDYAVRITDESGGSSLRVVVENTAAAERRERAFEFPDGPCGDDNYPALVHAVEELIDRPDLQFVLLADHEPRWRFVLVETDNLAALRSTYGARLEVFDRPLLADHQPPSFAAGAPVEYGPFGPDGTDDGGGFDPASGDEGEPAADPPGEDRPTPDTPGGDGTAPSTAGGPNGDDAPRGPGWLRRAVASEGGMDAVVEALSEGGPREFRSDRDVEAVVEDVASGGTDGPSGRRTTGEGIDDVFAAIEDDAGGEREGTPSGRRTTGESIDDVFAAIEDDAGDDDGGPAEVVADQGVDEVFAALEREAAAERPDPPESDDSLVGLPTDDGDDEPGFEEIAGGGPETVVSESSVDEVFDQFSEDSPEEVIDADGREAPGTADADGERPGPTSEAELEDLFSSFPEEMPDPDEVGPLRPRTEGPLPDPEDYPDAPEEEVAEGPPEEGTRTEEEADEPEDAFAWASQDDVDSPFTTDDPDSVTVATDEQFTDLAADRPSDPDELLGTDDDPDVEDLILDISGDAAPDPATDLDPSLPIQDAEDDTTDDRWEPIESVTPFDRTTDGADADAQSGDGATTSDSSSGDAAAGPDDGDTVDPDDDTVDPDDGDTVDQSTGTETGTPENWEPVPDDPSTTPDERTDGAETGAEGPSPGPDGVTGDATTGAAGSDDAPDRAGPSTPRPGVASGRPVTDPADADDQTDEDETIDADEETDTDEGPPRPGVARGRSITDPGDADEETDTDEEPPRPGVARGRSVTGPTADGETGDGNEKPASQDGADGESGESSQPARVSSDTAEPGESGAEEPAGGGERATVDEGEPADGTVPGDESEQEEGSRSGDGDDDRAGILARVRGLLARVVPGR